MSDTERHVILKWLTRTEMIQKWVVDIDKIIIEYGEMTLQWNDKIHGDGITFESNGNVVNSNGKRGNAFINCLMNRHTFNSDLISFEYEVPQFKYAFDFGFVQASMDKETGNLKLIKLVLKI